MFLRRSALMTRGEKDRHGVKSWAWRSLSSLHPPAPQPLGPLIFPLAAGIEELCLNPPGLWCSEMSGADSVSRTPPPPLIRANLGLAAVHLQPGLLGIHINVVWRLVSPRPGLSAAPRCRWAFGRSHWNENELPPTAVWLRSAARQHALNGKQLLWV